MKKHIIWMLIGCGIPLLLIFFAPMLGLGEDVSLFVFVIAMFACHLMMPQHGKHNHHHKKETTKTKDHE